MQSLDNKLITMTSRLCLTLALLGYPTQLAAPTYMPTLFPIKCYSIRNTPSVASYYSTRLVGRKTTSGEVYRENLMTVAHKTEPLGKTVTLCREDRPLICATVRINDRGPFIEGREWDLSKAAARKLGMLRQGLLKVRLK